MQHRVVNQDGEEVMTCEVKRMLKSRAYRDAQ
jgi:hypothetical protein